MSSGRFETATQRLDPALRSVKILTNEKRKGAEETTGEGNPVTSFSKGQSDRERTTFTSLNPTASKYGGQMSMIPNEI